MPLSSPTPRRLAPRRAGRSLRGGLRHQRQLRREPGRIPAVRHRLPLPQPAQPAGPTIAERLEDLVAFLHGRQDRHGAGRPDPGATARPRSARCARQRREPRGAAGPLVAPAQAAWQVLADRPGVQRARLTRAMGRPEALPRTASHAGRAAADRRTDPLAPPLRPPRPGRHRRAAGAGAALLRAAGRRRAAARRPGRARAHPGVRLVAAGPARRRAGHGHAVAAFLGPHAVGPRQHAVGVVGDRERRRAHLLQRRLRLLPRLRADRRTLRRLRPRADGERRLRRLLARRYT